MKQNFPTHVESSDWHSEDVKAILRKRFGSLSQLAREWGVSRQSVSGAIKNPMASTILEKKIAEAIGVSPRTIWPSRWREDETATSRSVRKNLNKPNKQNGNS